MPLTLECFCDGAASISTCRLQELTLHVKIATVPLGVTESNVGLGVFWGGVSHAGVDALVGAGTVETDIALPLAVRDIWDTFYVSFGGGSSTTQGPDAGTIYKAEWYVLAKYECTDSDTGLITAFERKLLNRQGGVDNCTGSEGSMAAVVGTGAGIYQIWWSRPLADNHFAVASGTQFDPLYDDILDLDHTETACLCPSGGTAPYTFSIVGGRLRDGEVLNEATGCIEGTPTGKDSGSYPITYRVVDATGQYAEVTCDYAGSNCPPCTEEAAGNAFY